MEFNNYPDNSSDKVKNRRGLLYAATLIVGFLAILGIVQCGDSSRYTLDPTSFNKQVILPILGVVIAAVVAIWIIKSKNKTL